jgi:flagella basal body P-ring formation protein FlgA
MTMTMTTTTKAKTWRRAAVWGAVVLVVVLFARRAARADETLTSQALQEALTAAVTIPGARADVVSLDRPSGDCITTGSNTRMEATRPIDGSGRFALKLVGARAGKACEVWAWARVKVFAQVPVASRSIRAGETLTSAVRIEEREIKPGHAPATLTDASVADRSLGIGQMIESDAVRAPGLRAGEPVKIILVSGTLAIEQTGRAVPCGRNRNCAVLPSGKHLEGTIADGRLVVQVP